MTRADVSQRRVAEQVVQSFWRPPVGEARRRTMEGYEPSGTTPARPRSGVARPVRRGASGGLRLPAVSVRPAGAGRGPHGRDVPGRRRGGAQETAAGEASVLAAPPPWGLGK